MSKINKAAYFADVIKDDFSESDKFSIIGDNTGNDAFIHAISNIIEIDRLPRNRINGDSGSLSEYNTFVTSDLIWIRQGVDAPDAVKTLLDTHPDKSIVAISMGLQSNKYTSDFKISPDMIYTLERISERASIAVRGNYTAEILSKNGINNIEIIGCPSVYQYPLYQNSFESLNNIQKINKSTSNFRTFYEDLSKKEREILYYFSCNFSGFVEQTKLKFSNMKPFSDGNYVEIRRWVEENEEIFFSLNHWVDYCSRYDFSMGSRFHGNVASILAGRRAMFIICDVRTRELVEFFSLPFIWENDFNPENTVQSYYESSDYSLFESDYHNKISKFLIFLRRNNLKISEKYLESLDRFKFYRIGRPWAAHKEYTP